jgi:hypothetical protein
MKQEMYYKKNINIIIIRIDFEIQQNSLSTTTTETELRVNYYATQESQCGMHSVSSFLFWNLLLNEIEISCTCPKKIKYFQNA